MNAFRMMTLYTPELFTCITKEVRRPDCWYVGSVIIGMQAKYGTNGSHPGDSSKISTHIIIYHHISLYRESNPRLRQRNRVGLNSANRHKQNDTSRLTDIHFSILEISIMSSNVSNQF